MWYICYPDVVNMEKMAGSAWVIADMVMHFIGRIWCFLWNVFLREKGKALMGLMQ